MGRHADAPAFGESIAGISLGAEATMQFASLVEPDVVVAA